MHSSWTSLWSAVTVLWATHPLQIGAAKVRQEQPCSVVSREWATQTAADPTRYPEINGQLAFDCLNSVVLHELDASRLIRSIKTFLPWQTTAAYLKDPPPDWPFPAFDIDDAIPKLIDNINQGVYGNEYEFQADLFATFNRAKDGHFRFHPDLLTAPIQFRRGSLALVSVSFDGVSLPRIYELSDIRHYNNDSSFTPSPVTLLNGKDAFTAVMDSANLGSLRDLDAQYNTMFYSPAFYALDEDGWQGFYGGSGRFGNIWPGASTAVTFENGTTINYTTVARITGNFSDISGGETLYAKYCRGKKPVALVATPTSAAPTAAATTQPAQVPDKGNLTAEPPRGYPVPVVITSDQSASGYFISDTDVAVLAMPTFGPQIPAEFQLAVQTLIQHAKEAGKTKLIVDVSANRGGLIFQGYDTFRQLFPQVLPDGFNRFRSTELLQMSARQFSAGIPPGFDPLTSDNKTLIDIWESYPNYRFDLDRNNQPFGSQAAKFSEDIFKNDTFTQIHRWNFDDPLVVFNDTFGYGFEMTGYRTRQNFTQPFAPENVVVLTDGYCGSTCATFAEFLRVQVPGVKFVTFGGRPLLDANGKIPIIQNFGGTKGTNNYDIRTIANFANFSLDISRNLPGTTSLPVTLTNEEVRFLKLNTDDYAFNRSTSSSFNVRDNILRDHLGDGLPAQFIYEPTDCRLFYTPRSIIDPMEQWKQVAEAAWGGAKCVAGALNSSAQGTLRRHQVLTERQMTMRQKELLVINLPGRTAMQNMSPNWLANNEMSTPL